MVKVAGAVCVDIGYQNAMVTCGTADGEIKTTVKETKRTANHDESNFGKGYAYQFWDKGYINVRMDNRWILFKDIDLQEEGNPIPEGVDHFTAKFCHVRYALV